jgi:acylphosphatase
MSEPTVRVRAVVHGRVQGVGYRAFAVAAGARLGVRGRVANQPDGTVECVAEGPRPAVETLVRRLHEGPGMARVERVEIREEAGGETLPPMHFGGWG